MKTVNIAGVNFKRFFVVQGQDLQGNFFYKVLEHYEYGGKTNTRAASDIRFKTKDEAERFVAGI